MKPQKINNSMKILKNIIVVVLIFFTHISIAQDQSIIRLPDNIVPEDRLAFAMYTVHENRL